MISELASGYQSKRSRSQSEASKIEVSSQVPLWRSKMKSKGSIRQQLQQQVQPEKRNRHEKQEKLMPQGKSTKNEFLETDQERKLTDANIMRPPSKIL